ncbi:MAG: hypothetical protein ACK4YP_12855 [Myxococcota bacterium]
MDRRWNVVVLRHPSGWSAPGRSQAPRPVVAWTGARQEPAERAAAALRDLGAEVVLVEGSADALCPAHPTQLRGETCATCATRICPSCQLAADGAARCASCHARVVTRARHRRLRQLVAMLAFVAFLHQVWTWMARENALLEGPVRVAFVQLVEPEVAGAPLVAAMNAEGDGLARLAPWFQAERARYVGMHGQVIDADVLGPWVTPVEPPTLPPRNPGFLDALRVALTYPRYFHDLARAHGVDPDAYGARVYVVYGRETGDLAGDSRGSRKGRVAVSFVPATSSVAYAQITVAHELAHVLGAADRYDGDTYLARFPEGYVQPWAERPWPQRYAELMAVDVPLTPRDEREARSLDEVRIGYRTAAELGWIDEKQADLYYTPALRGPEETLVVADGESLGTR